MVFAMANGGGGTPPPAGTGSTGAIGSYQQQYGIGVPSAGSAGTADPYVYLGRGSSHYDVDPSTGYVTGGPTYSDKTKTLDEMMQDFGKKSREDQKRWAYMLALGGYVGVPASKAAEWADQANLQDVIGAYADFLKDAAAAAPNKITPMQLLTRGIKYNLPGWNGKVDDLDEAAAKAGIAFLGTSGISGGEPEKFTGTKKFKSTSFNFMDPTDAKMLAMNTLQRELGRDPTQAEYEDFIGAIHAAEKRNPSVTTTTSTYDEGELTDQTSTTTGGVNAEYVALQKARQNPGWAEWQAVGTYAPALFQALGAAVPGT